MEYKRVRISDIAEELGVSAATVSNVIHGRTNKVSEETIHRVQELLEKRQYIPSMAGILLAQNDSGIIGVIVNQHEKYENHVLEDAFISSSLNYLSVEIEKTGKFMMVKTATQAQDIVKDVTSYLSLEIRQAAVAVWRYPFCSACGKGKRRGQCQL